MDTPDDVLSFLKPYAHAAAGAVETGGSGPRFRPHDQDAWLVASLRRALLGSPARTLRRGAPLVDAFAAAVMRERPALARLLTGWATRYLYAGGAYWEGLFVPLFPDFPPVAAALADLTAAGVIAPTEPVEVAPGSDPELAYEPGRPYRAWKLVSAEASGRYVAAVLAALNTPSES